MALAWTAAAMALAQAAPPLLPLGAGDIETSLVPALALDRLPVATPIVPDALWAAPVVGPDAAQAGKLRLESGQWLVGRVRLAAARDSEEFRVEVPSSRIDEVQLWYRKPGVPWRMARAGDRVPLSQWPFLGPSPVFLVPVDTGETDLVILLRNVGRLDVPVLVKSGRMSAKAQIRQSNLSGLVMGAGLMVAVVCLISALTLRRTSAWVLFAFAVWAGITITCLNGYAAIWFLPEWPDLVDGSKLIASVVMVALLLWVVVASVDRLKSGTGLHALGVAATVCAVAYSVVQLLWLPAEWRVPGALAFSAVCVLAALAVCTLSWMGGGRYVGLLATGVAMYAVVLALGAFGTAPTEGLDLRAALAGVMLFAAALVLRHAQFARERYGQDVLGRAAVGRLRDPLTALLSHAGLQRACEQVMLRQNTDGRPSLLVYLELPELEASEAQHGFVLTERALVRLAAVVQKALGDGWAIARLGKDRFACVGHGASEEPGPLSTRLLAHCARLQDPLSPVNEFGLRMAAGERRIDGDNLDSCLQEMQLACRGLLPGRRIALV